MKKLIAFFICFILLGGVKFIKEDNLPSYDFQKLIVISKQLNQFEVESIKNGNQYYYTFTQENKEKLKDIKIKEVDGLVYYFAKEKGLENIKEIFDFSYASKEEIDGLDIWYGYSNDYPRFNIIKGKMVNCQIVENSTNIIVGFPMILCGY